MVLVDYSILSALEVEREAVKETTDTAFQRLGSVVKMLVLNYTRFHGPGSNLQSHGDIAWGRRNENGN